MKKVISILLAVVMLLTPLINMMPVQAETTTSLTTNKTVYQKGESVLVTAKSTNAAGTDWVCISLKGASSYIYWDYTVDMTDNFDIKTASHKVAAQQAYWDLPVGEYTIYLIPNNMGFASGKNQALATVDIQVVEFTTNKTVYAEGEPILVTAQSANANGKDWISITKKDDRTRSIRWEYLADMTTEFDMRTASHKVTGLDSLWDIPEGEYSIVFIPNDMGLNAGWDSALGKIDIKVISEDAAKAKAPLSATYKLDNETDGMADGTLTIQLPEEHSAEDIYMWWANEDGKLSGYTRLAPFKVTGTTIVHEMTENTIIPKGATKLRIYTYNDAYGVSEEYLDVALPEGAASEDFGTPISEFQVVSDLHIGRNDDCNQHFLDMLNDVKANSADTQGVFVVGDIVQTGSNADHWTKYSELYESVTDAPTLYLGVGNHEFYDNLTHEEGMGNFLPYVKLPDGSTPTTVNYDFWLNGYHYVFIGRNNDATSTKAVLDQEQLDWLKETLAENRDGRPIFLFMHEPMPNTVSGSSTEEGWGHVENPEDLKAVLNQFPEVRMFNGHTHWRLDSDNCMYDGNGTTASIFNTASVGYLWQSYDIVTGEAAEGSEGYYIRVYEDKIAVLGRNFETGEWVSSAQFVVENSGLAVPSEDGSSVALGQSGIEWSDADREAQNPPKAKADAYEEWLFAGWYEDATCETPIEDINKVSATSYAKFVPKEILNMKFQVSNGTIAEKDNKYAIRLISSVDSLQYKDAGFQIYNETTGAYDSYSVVDKTVYQKIESTVGELEYKFSPEIIDLKSEYFMTSKLAISDTSKNYKIRAWWQTFDGTVVTGDARCVSVSDAASDVLNLTVDGTLDTTGNTTYTASFTSSARNDVTTDDVVVADATVTVLDASNVRITLSGVTAEQMASATLILIKEATSGTVVTTGVYRNYYTTYTGEGTEDTSWYYMDTDATEFTIASSADLYGFAEIMNSYKFPGKYIRQVADIDLNPGWTAPESGDESVTAPSNVWAPMEINASNSVGFSGTMDGCGNTISGMYIESSNRYAGLFKRIENTATLKNMVLQNSYIKHTSDHWTGSFTGFSYGGTLENLYSDAIIVTSAAQSGGIAGRAEGTVSGCWFDGEIRSTKTSAGIISMGGIVGSTQLGGAKYPATFKNCLNTGSIIWDITSDANLGLGGILGAPQAATPSITFIGCVNAGTISAGTANGVGAIVGVLNKADTLYTIENCYVRADSITGLTGDAAGRIAGAITAGADGSAVTGSVAVELAALQGAAIYENADIKLDYDAWTARKDGTVFPSYFAGLVVPQKDVIYK